MLTLDPHYHETHFRSFLPETIACSPCADQSSRLIPRFAQNLLLGLSEHMLIAMDRQALQGFGRFLGFGSIPGMCWGKEKATIT